VAVPLVHEIQASLLYPALEIALRNLVGCLKHAVAGSKNFHRSLFHGNSAPAQLRREGRKVAAIEVAGAGVVLHNQRASSRDKTQQLLVVGRDIFLSVVCADTEDDRSVTAQVFTGKPLRGND